MSQTTATTQSRLSNLSIFAVILAGWIASGCGASQSGGPVASSISSISPLNNLLGDSSQNTNCNQMTTASTNFSAKLRTVEGTPDMMRIRITGLTSQFDGNPSANIQFFRWKVAGGVSALDSVALTFHIETASQYGAGGHSLTNNMTGINMANINQVVSSNFMGTTTAEQFFNKVDVIVHGVSLDYQTLKFVIYNGGAVLASNDALLPPFSANPSTYNSTHAAVLNGLHPFTNQLGYSDAQYLKLAKGFCF